MKDASNKLLVWAVALFLLVVALGFAANAGWTGGADQWLGSALALRAGEGADGVIAFWYWISWSGGGVQRYVMVALLAVLIGFWLHWRSGVMFAAMALLSNITSNFMKDAFGRPRPDLVPHLDPVNSLSYPSGHATSAALVYLLFALLVPTARRPAWFAAAAVLAFLTGLSRLTLGVHWPSDVIGGWIMGSAFAIAGVALLRRFGQN